MKIILNEAEISSLKTLLASLSSRYASVEDPELLREAAVISHELPRSLRQALYDFKLLEPSSAACLISGYPVDDEGIGRTPSHWQWEKKPSPVLEEEILLVLLGSCLGECIGWLTQQDGRIVHDILPIKGHEGEQLGSGSEQLLWWHTEDAFHPYRGDYLGMMCLRNPDAVPTTFCNLGSLNLDPEARKLLFEPHFTIRPDESHLQKNKSDLTEPDRLMSASYARIEQMYRSPEKIAILSGDPATPYIRIDPYFMDPVADNPRAQAALDSLVRAIDQTLQDLVLRPGDFCFMDNFMSVHGRKPFKARFDGTDRWLKRINITRDLRKSRNSRRTSDSRVIV